MLELHVVTTGKVIQVDISGFTELHLDRTKPRFRVIGKHTAGAVKGWLHWVYSVVVDGVSSYGFGVSVKETLMMPFIPKEDFERYSDTEVVDYLVGQIQRLQNGEV